MAVVRTSTMLRSKERTKKWTHFSKKIEYDVKPAMFNIRNTGKALALGIQELKSPSDGLKITGV